MAKDKVYWTTKDGRKLDIDTMDEKHVRNCLKMLVRQIYERKGQESINKLRRNTVFDYDPYAAQEIA